MQKWEQTKHYATIGIYGGFGLVAFVLAIAGKGQEVNIIFATAFIILSWLEGFSVRARQVTTKRKRSAKSQVKVEIKEANEDTTGSIGTNSLMTGTLGFKQGEKIGF